MAPALKSAARVPDHEPVVALGRPCRPRAAIMVDRVDADDVELAVELEAQDPVAQVDHRGRRRSTGSSRTARGRPVEAGSAVAERARCVAAKLHAEPLSYSRCRHAHLGEQLGGVGRRGRRGARTAQAPSRTPSASRRSTSATPSAISGPTRGRVAEVGGQRPAQELAGAVRRPIEHPQARCAEVGLVARHLRRRRGDLRRAAGTRRSPGRARGSRRPPCGRSRRRSSRPARRARPARA